MNGRCEPVHVSKISASSRQISMFFERFGDENANFQSRATSIHMQHNALKKGTVGFDDDGM